ncbi:competence type IV pilus minor pilin ComGF [Priestia abyssalis]|uniref:competence type IV pilus minor pilin ComGF n=1 Tax=Priestia abyssalis TaxID=1221450 RepID=UPI00099523D0|nr:competence type IV pilus minor pilin ComGF [Priestia abyssalis]
MKKEAGYTLLEMLISFSLFLMMMSFVPIIIKMTKEHQETSVSLSTLEWDLFVQQLTSEIRTGHQVECSHQKLTFVNDSHQTVTYEKYGNMIRRRVNGNGHEVALQNISSAQFIKVHQGVLIQIKDLESRLYAERMSLFNREGIEMGS